MDEWMVGYATRQRWYAQDRCEVAESGWRIEDYSATVIADSRAPGLVLVTPRFVTAAGSVNGLGLGDRDVEVQLSPEAVDALAAGRACVPCRWRYVAALVDEPEARCEVCNAPSRWGICRLCELDGAVL